MMRLKICPWILGLFVLPVLAKSAEPLSQADLTFCCTADNDLYRVMTSGAMSFARFESPEEAVKAAAAGSGVLILADGYPKTTTRIPAGILETAAARRLRLFVEFPESLPEMRVGAPRRTILERAVVASDVFGPSLPQRRILAIHDCHFVEVEAAKADLVVAKVAGFDTAVFGLDDVKTHPLLFGYPGGTLLVATTKLSQFVTARYATKEAMQAVWRYVLQWLQPGKEVPELVWTPTVRPTYTRDEPLPTDAVRRAIERGIDWHARAGMLCAPKGKDAHAGDGSLGVKEGIRSRIAYDGSQPVNPGRRSDCNGETALAFALRWRLDGNQFSRQVAGNLLDWLYFDSGLLHNDPAKADYGLLAWTDTSPSLYGDNDIKAILSCMGTAAVLQTERWDEVLLRDIVGNFRTAGIHSFRRSSLNDGQLLKEGWQHYWRARTIHYAPHYEAWIWAAYLWLYDKTGYKPLLERTRHGIRMMMAAYPDHWRWTNGIQQERGRMLLTLAWLIRVDDRPEHRAWLKRMAEDMQKCQVACGAIREELGPAGKGQFRPTQSNAEYGTREASLIHENGDPVADLLYTCNFAFLGLHEAYAATGEEQYARMADRLAEFLVRIQVRSEVHPGLDGGWFRAFDFRQWDYWGSNADAGWGAWSIEVGWTQAWIPTVLAMRQLDVNLWDLTKSSQIAKHWEKTRAQMLPEDQIKLPVAHKTEHLASAKPVALRSPPHPSYSGGDAIALTDSCLGNADHTAPEWLGFLGKDFVATIDMGAPADIQSIAVNFLQSTRWGILLPPELEVAVSNDGNQFRTLKTLKSTAATSHTEPRTVTLTAADLGCRARYVRVRAVTPERLPEWIKKKPTPAWLFVDEIIVK